MSSSTKPLAIWHPKFNTNAKIVYNKFRRGYYPKPENVTLFQKHLEIIDLKIVRWKIENDHFILGGFCKVHYVLKISFQATLEFAQEEFKADYIPDVNERIKSDFLPLIEIIVENELINLDREVKDDYNRIKKIVEDELKNLLEGKRNRQEEIKDELIQNLKDELWRKYEREIDFSTFISKRQDSIVKAIIDELKDKKIICQSSCELTIFFNQINLDDETSADFIHQEIYNLIKAKRTNLKHDEIRKDKQDEIDKKNINLEYKIKEFDQQRDEDQLNNDKDIYDLKKVAKSEVYQIKKQRMTRRVSRLKEKIATQIIIDKGKEERLREFELMKIDAEPIDDAIKLIKKEGELIDAQQGKQIKENELEFLKTGGQKKIEMFGILNEEARIKAKNVLQYERQEKLFAMLPEIFREINKNSPKLDQLKILNMNSDKNISNSNNPFDSTVQLAHAFKLLKEMLSVMDE